MTSEKPETKLEKPKTTASTKSEKPLVFLPQTENQVLIEENPKTKEDTKTEKPLVFVTKTEKPI